MPDPRVPLLEVRQLGCRRGRRRLFRDLSFSLSAGEALHIAGPNGSGKTTLLRMLAGLRSPDEGLVLWRGQPAQQQAAEFRAALRFIGHQPGVKAELTPQENLRAAAALSGSGAADPAEALRQLGLEPQAGRLCGRLSAGQRQRVALARLLLQPAPLWLLDEPCASLDYAAQRDFERMLGAHVRGGGAAIFTTHQSITLEQTAVRRLELAS